MNQPRFAALAALSVTCALASAPSASAALVRFNATLDAAQEVPATTSTATGTAVVWYDTMDNTVDITVMLDDLANTVSNSHIHEGAVGVSGPPVVPIGDESNYTRDGMAVTGTFVNLSYDGDPAVLLAGGAYLNIHSAEFAAGEIRGQLVPEPVRFSAVLSGDQEVPARETDAYGAAQAVYDPVNNTITTLVYVYNFSNTLSGSHIHEAPAGTNGSVMVGFGDGTAYENSGTTYAQVFSDMAYGGTPMSLLNEGAYVNVHSDVFAGGEIRGQLMASTAGTRSRLINVSARGQVGTGDGVLIAGFIVEGSEPLTVLATGRGPYLEEFDVAGVLADPMVRVHDVQGRVLLSNDNYGTAPLQTQLMVSGLAPTIESEAAVFLLLPPGAYTSILSGAGETTGVGLVEAYEVNW